MARSRCEGRAKSQERTKLLDARKLYRDALAAKEALSDGTSSAMTLDDAIENNPYLKGLAERRRNGEISEDSFGQLWREAIRRIEEDFERGSASNDGNARYSFAGEKSNTANSSLLQMAKEMDSEGISNRNRIDNYTEEQYNNFGWINFNKVVSFDAEQRAFSDFADYKKHNYRLAETDNNEVVIPAGDDVFF